MHKLTPTPSKAKNRALARTVLTLVLVCIPAVLALASDISIRSGEGEDTVMQVGPGVGDGAQGRIVIESDPDNGSLMQVLPAPAPQDAAPSPPVIVVPEIRYKEK